MQTDGPDERGRWFLAPITGRKDLPEALRAEGAFLPRPLPSVEVALSLETQGVVADAHRTLGALAEAARRGQLDRIVRVVRIRDALASAGLDGIPASVDELVTRELPGSSEFQLDDTTHAYVRAATRGIARARRGDALDVDIFGELSAITSGMSLDDAPHWRDDIKLVGDVPPTRGVLISAPPGPELIAATAQFCSWVASEREMPVVCKVALGFYQALVLSPMPGSDHLARLWPTMELVRRNILPDQVLPFADVLGGYQAEFERHLRGVVDRGDLDSWVKFVAEIIRTACHDQLHQISRQTRTSDELAEPYIHKTRAAQLVLELIDSPIINAPIAAQRLGISERYARTLLHRLHEDGVLKLVAHTRSGKIYRCHQLMRVYGVIQKTATDVDL